MATFPGSGTASIPVTLNIYQSGGVIEPGNGVIPGALIKSVTVNVTPPANTGTLPVNFTVSFDFGGVTLPSDVVYGIAYDDSTADTGLNVNLSYESSSVPSAGADTFPGFLFASTKSGNNEALSEPNRGDYVPEREFYVCTVRHLSPWKLWAERDCEWPHNRSRSSREVDDQLTHPATSPAKAQGLAIEAALCGLNRFPELCDPAETPAEVACSNHAGRIAQPSHS